MTQAYFPNFVPNQVLTNVQLNELRQFLDEQNRLTRTRLIGMGIVCGLNPSLGEDLNGNCVLTISEGFGITSDGYLIEIPEKVLVQVRQYTDPYLEPIDETVLPGNNGALWPVYEPWRLPPGNIDLNQAPPVTQIPIAELLTQAELDDPNFVQEVGNISAPITKDDLGCKVLVLYLEMDPQNLKSCLTTDCNNKGQNLHLHVRVLLIDRQYLEPVVPCTPQLDLVQVPRLHVGLHKTANIGLDGVTAVQEINDAYADIAHYVKDTLVPKIQSAYTTWNPLIGLHDLKSYVDDLDTRLSAILNANVINQYHYDFFKDLAQAYNEFSRLLCDLVKDCCIAGNFPRHLMLGEIQCVCVDLDGNDGALMENTLTQAGNQVVLSNGIRATATVFTSKNGSTFFNQGKLDNPFDNFGTGQIWRFNNMCVVFDFTHLPKPVQSVSFDFYFAGGTDNFSVNGQTVVIDPIFNAPANIAPNVTLTVVAGPSPGLPNNTVGKITLTGPIQTVQIGGQELWIDNLCTDQLVLDTHGPYRNHFMPSPVRNVMHNDLERTRRLFWRIIDLSRYFAIPFPAAIKITPSQTEAFDLGKRAVPYYYQDEARPNWPPVLCCTPPALNYADNSMTEPTPSPYLDYLPNPLHYSVLPHGFYRIEGHLYQDCADVMGALGQLRQVHNLEFALLMLHLEEQYTAPDTSQIETLWSGIALNWNKINDLADSGNFDDAAYKIYTSQIATQTQNLLQLNDTWVQEHKLALPPCDLSALESDYLQVRSELFCLIHKIKPVLEQLPDVGGQPIGQEACVLFTPLQVGQQFTANTNSPGDEIFVESGVHVTLELFQFSSGGTAFNGAIVENDNNGKFVSLNNINMRFDFGSLGFSPTEVTFRISDFGGTENIAVNNNKVVIGEISQNFNGQTIAPGIVFNFTPSSPTNQSSGIGTVTALTGDIKSFQIGGQEFFLYEVCAHGISAGSPALNEPSYKVRFAQLEYLCRLLDEITLKDLRCLNYILFARVLKQLIGVAIEIRLQLALFYQSTGVSFNAYQYYPVWQDLEHCLGHIHYNCLLPRFANLYYTLEHLLKGSAQVFKNFAAQHPGLEHQAGVPKGGTFILLCEEGVNAADAVVADFALEHFLDTCCCHLDVNDLCLPPVALPDYRIAGAATTLTIEVMQNDFYQNDISNLAVELITQVSDKGGALSLGGTTTTVQYTRPANASGIDHFTYRLVDRGCKEVVTDVGHVYILLSQVAAACPFPPTKSPAQLSGLLQWNVQPLFTVGESISGYTPPGAMDGIGAMKISNTSMRFYISHNIRTVSSYPYQLANGLQLNGSRISFIDYDFTTKCFSKAGLAFKTIYDRSGKEVTNANQISLGLKFFSSGALYRAGQYGFNDNLYFTGEGISDGTAYALDIKPGELYALPFLGKAAWKNVTALDTGEANFIALLIGDNRASSPLLLYLGQKDKSAGASFLARNGLAQGRLFAWISTQGGQNPAQFKGTGTQRAGRFVQIQHFSPGQAGYDQLGFATQSTQDDLYKKAKAFTFSMPVDLSVNPENGKQVVFASSGTNAATFGDQWGMVYRVNVLFESVTGGAVFADITILYDANDMGGGQFNDPDLGLRNPDNVDWAKNGMIYIQENPLANQFGKKSGAETSVWELIPATGKIRRIAQTNRAAVPAGQQDTAPTTLGAWPSFGALDVNDIFADPQQEAILVCNVQAHSLKGGPIDSGELMEGGQLLLMSKKLSAGPGNLSAGLQIVQNLTDSKVDLYVGNDLLIKDFAANTASPVLNLPAGSEISIGIAPANSKSAADVVQKFPVTLTENQNHVSVISAPPDGTAGAVLTLSEKAGLTAVAADEVALSFYHGAADIATLTVTADGTAWFKSIKAGQFTDPVTVAAKTYQLALSPAKVNADPKDVYLADLSFLAGHSALIYASGSPKNGDFGLWISMSNGGVFPLPLIKKDTPASPQQVVIRVPKTDSTGRISFDEMTVKFDLKSATPAKKTLTKKSKKS